MAHEPFERVAGGLVGLLVGDALGVPYEFRTAAQIPDAAQIEFEPPPGYDRAHRGVPPGTWSDDGAQALCLLESLLIHDRLDLADFARRLLAWARKGHLAVDGVVFDIGLQTSAALRALEQGVAPHRAGRDGERDNGNGSLMRVLPLALWHRGTDEELVELAHGQSLPTHGHTRAHVCCALYCLWARGLLRGERRAYDAAVGRLQAIYGGMRPYAAELGVALGQDGRVPDPGSGYVVDTLHSARLVVHEPDYAGVVRAAIRLGHDTDTTAAVAGGLAGIAHGLRGIPERWRAGLRGAAILQPLLARLREHLQRAA